MKRQGSKVSLVPIPKLKPQAIAPMPKSSKKVQKKNSEVKTKKVASISFLGVFLYMLLFGELVPLLKVRYGVSRNNKLVEIDGNSTIQSVLASEKALAFHGSADKKNKEANLAIPGRFRPCCPTNPSSPLSKSFSWTKDSWIRGEEKFKVNYAAK
ncbi:hypothetical protein RDI58_010760 [Solanum bulbocastanum]|uniref:Uncharacterized protein n=1 Tax=Solanum bulbocastanum TaxID=147425 RepID=A0AAN8YFP0_SOLBU